MNKKEYWQKRFELLEEMELNKAESYIEELEEQYILAYNEVEKKIIQWYNRYASENNISFAEAQIQLTKGELKEFQWSVEEYIKYAKENGMDMLWQQQLKNASARVHISRLDALRTHIQHEVEKLYDKQLKGLESIEEMIYTDTYYHTAYELQVGNNVGFSFQGIDNNKIKKILSTPWGTDEATFSDRIWKNKQDLVNVLKNELTQATLKGSGMKDVIDVAINKFKVKANKVGRLVMTESAFFSSSAQKDCFNNLGVEKCMILGTLDSTTCGECGELDGTIVVMKDFISGVTTPPFHPWCRCTTIPYFEDEFEFSERAARDTNGKTTYIPENTNYKEWKKKYIDSDLETKNKFNTEQKMRKNNSSDFEQYNRYKNVLGKNLSKSFEEFQEMKYNNIDEYKNLKAQYLDTKGITSEEEARKYITNINKNINTGKQDKHILGSNNYIQGKSYVTISSKDIQELVNKYAGTGTLQFSDSGKWSKKEIITTDKNIGVVKNKNDEIKTNSFKIHYSKNGVHIVPYRKGNS